MKQGFVFPKFHGLTVIWSVASIVGILITITREIDVMGLLLSLVFLITVFFSASSIMESIKTRFTSMYKAPWIILGSLVIILVLYKPVVYTLYYFMGIGSLLLIWMGLASQTKKQSTSELALGATNLTLLASILVYYGTRTTDMTWLFQQFALLWVLSGASVILVLHVQVIRKQVHRLTPLLIWTIYLLTFTPLLLAGVLPILVLLAFIEPTIHGLWQVWKTITNQPIKRQSFKRIGIELTIRLSLFASILLIVTIAL